jgi:hypothetical protein
VPALAAYSQITTPFALLSAGLTYTPFGGRCGLPHLYPLKSSSISAAIG